MVININQDRLKTECYFIWHDVLKLCKVHSTISSVWASKYIYRHQWAKIFSTWHSEPRLLLDLKILCRWNIFKKRDVIHPIFFIFINNYRHKTVVRKNEWRIWLHADIFFSVLLGTVYCRIQFTGYIIWGNSTVLQILANLWWFS